MIDKRRNFFKKLISLFVTAPTISSPSNLGIQIAPTCTGPYYEPCPNGH